MSAVVQAFASMKSTVLEDWSSGIVQVSMMGLQGQTVVGSMVGLLQAVYLVQFGARAGILSNYLVLSLPLNFAASCLAVAVLVSASMRHAWCLFTFGCWSSLVASLALTFPLSLYDDADEQATFISHYFGWLFTVATASAKLRDYPLSMARVYLLHGTRARASENAYNKICDVMVGNALNGALLLTLLAHPSDFVKWCLCVLQLASTLVSLRGAGVLRTLVDAPPDELPQGSSPADRSAEVIGFKTPDADESAERVDYVMTSPGGSAGGAGSLLIVRRLALSGRLWQLMVVEFCVSFIFTLNNQAFGSIYWSSIVGVSDAMRSMYIALEASLGGCFLGIATTWYVTRLYHQGADTRIVIPRIVSAGAFVGSAILATLGTTSLGALLGITSLYLYYFVFAWSNIEFLSFMDELKAEYRSEFPLLCSFLVKDVVSSAMNNLRNMLLLWSLAATGFYEPDCRARCADVAASDVDCVARCHAEAHASISQDTVYLVRALYVVVTPGAYLLACVMIRRYKAPPALCAAGVEIELESRGCRDAL